MGLGRPRIASQASHITGEVSFSTSTRMRNQRLPETSTAWRQAHGADYRAHVNQGASSYNGRNGHSRVATMRLDSDQRGCCQTPSLYDLPSAGRAVSIDRQDITSCRGHLNTISCTQTSFNSPAYALFPADRDNRCLRANTHVRAPKGGQNGTQRRHFPACRIRTDFLPISCLRAQQAFDPVGFAARPLPAP